VIRPTVQPQKGKIGQISDFFDSIDPTRTSADLGSG
jgi:hypothetical protein